ncbi:MAG: hypothetical protein R2851_23170 [Caldilineaceae bacterium]
MKPRLATSWAANWRWKRPTPALRLADELLLEWALGYLALNLHPRPRLLDKAEHLFRQAGQPFELAQTLYTRAALACPGRDRHGPRRRRCRRWICGGNWTTRTGAIGRA